MTRLAGRVAVVTGAAAGLGRAIALRFAGEGANVVAVDIRPSVVRDPSGGASTVQAIEGAGGLVTPVIADLTTADGIDAVLGAALAINGRVDILVNNAGRFGGSSLLQTTDEEWNFYLALNLTSVFRMCRAFVGHMVDQAPIDAVRGRVINMGSQLGITAPPGAIAYAATKAGVIHLTRQIAVDYARSGIVANAIAPGRIITGDHPGERDYLDHGTVDQATRYSLERTPFARLGVPEDVAGAALFLASSDSTFVSGSIVSVDGGWTAY